MLFFAMQNALPLDLQLFLVNLHLKNCKGTTTNLYPSPNTTYHITQESSQQ